MTLDNFDANLDNFKETVRYALENISNMDGWELAGYSTVVVAGTYLVVPLNMLVRYLGIIVLFYSLYNIFFSL